MCISVVWSGYVGTTITACFADFAHDVVNVEIDEDIVETIKTGDSPIHEAGLSELIAEHAGDGSTNRLRATTDYDAVLDANVTFLCLPTPQDEDGNIDLSDMKAGAEQLGGDARYDIQDAIHKQGPTVDIVVKDATVQGFGGADVHRERHPPSGPLVVECHTNLNQQPTASNPIVG